MAGFEVWLYREGMRVPFVEWLSRLAPGEQDVVNARVLLLAAHGASLRRPHADALAEGILELRARHRRRQLRILYFFHGPGSAVITHGFVRRGARVEPSEITLAIRRRWRYRSDPASHRFPRGG